MSEEMPNIISHLSLGTNDFDKAIAFYDKVMEVLGCEKTMDYPGAVAYGKNGLPIFWVQIPIDGKSASVGNGTHIAFQADSKEMVHSFHEVAMAAGGIDDGPPGPRPDYGEAFYGCYIRDPDGHKIEATFWDFSKM